MKNIIKTTAYSAVALSSVAYTNAIQWDKSAKVDDRVIGAKGDSGNIGETVLSILAYLLGFLALIAVIFAIYAGFQILTAGGDEEKVKKGKTTLINALIGIFVIWISWALVNWVMTGFDSGVVTGG